MTIATPQRYTYAMKKPLPPIPQATPHAATATVAPHAREATPNVVAFPLRLPNAKRQAVTLQSGKHATAEPMPDDIDKLCAFLPDTADFTDPHGNPPHVTDCREWLTCSPVVTQEQNAVTVSLGTPPDGLSRVERVLWPTLGATCARASLFLYNWLESRRYMDSCVKTGCTTVELTMCKEASPVFFHLFERVQAAVRTTKLNRSEDTLHAWANGDLTEPVYMKVKDADGNESIEKAADVPIRSEKALALELSALDRARYGTVAASGSGVSITVNVSAPRPEHVVTVAPVATAAESETVDFDMVEA